MTDIKVCYVVVASGWDRHAQMAWLSAYSVRLQDPGVRIVIVLEAPADAADALVRRFSGVADDVLLRQVDETNPVKKSRLHRLALRDYVDGDLLYVDSDTLAVRPVSPVSAYREEVGAVMDFNHPADSTWCPPELEGTFLRLGWAYPLPRFFNAGVIFMRDTARVRAFCAEWAVRFRTPSDAPEHTWDQSTFNSALFASGASYVVLPHDYNAMIVKRGYRFRTARLLHFFGSAEEQRGTLMEQMLKHLGEHDEFDVRTYRRCIREGHPWGPNPEPWQLYRSRNYVRAASRKLGKLVSSVAGRH
ncbi:MAG: hypothetical protein U0P82_10725 [Vicinamibacterales bacterium]